MVEIAGFAPARFAGVKDAFAANFAEGLELGARFTLVEALAALLMARSVEQGRLAYDQRVAEVWPEFAQAGKGAITVEQALSHQAGLSGFPDETDPAIWFDWDATCAKLAAMAPLFPIGSASG